MSRLPDAPNARAEFVRRILERLHRAYGPVRPWRREDPVVFLIGTILAQATNDVLAERAYRALRKRFPSWAKVHAAPQCQVEDAIRMCGLAAQKARAIKNFLAFLKETRGTFSLNDLRRQKVNSDSVQGAKRTSSSKAAGCALAPARERADVSEANAGRGGHSAEWVDAALAELSSVNGIGIKTATITLMFGCNADLCAVDTHLQRILQRLRIAPPKASPDRACRILRPLLPPGRGIELHLQLIRFGRTVCKAQRPQCTGCALRACCPSKKMSDS